MTSQRLPNFILTGASSLVFTTLFFGLLWILVAKAWWVVGIPSDAYAADWMSIFVIEHLKESGGEWPQGWHDLRDEYERLEDPSHYAWTFEELQERVVFRFDVTSDEVRNAEPMMRVFELSSGRQVSYDGDPNERIRDFLLSGDAP